MFVARQDMRGLVTHLARDQEGLVHGAVAAHDNYLGCAQGSQTHISRLFVDMRLESQQEPHDLYSQSTIS